MNALKMLKLALVALVFFAFTSCQPEQINPRQADGDPQTQDPIVLQ